MLDRRVISDVVSVAVFVPHIAIVWHDYGSVLKAQSPLCNEVSRSRDVISLMREGYQHILS
jgi:hypothetical protein